MSADDLDECEQHFDLLGDRGLADQLTADELEVLRTWRPPSTPRLRRLDQTIRAILARNPKGADQTPPEEQP